jgi:hypothetical protein
MQAIRIGDFQGVRYNVTSHSDDFEIYNVVKDPQQTRNLARDKKFAALQQQMKNEVLEMRRPDSSARRPYDNELVPAIEVAAPSPGVEWSVYEKTFPWVPEMTALESSSHGTEKTPTIANHSSDKNFGMLFTGYISAPADGDYTIYVKADTGALLRIHEATVIDADFAYKSGEEKSGSIQLKKGLHPFRLYFAHRDGGKASLQIEWSGPNFNRQPIPASALFHGGTAASQNLR